MSFLPENYESPKSSGHYMKFQDGENRIRILSRAIVGWEDWQDKKPVRFRMDSKPVKAIDPAKPIKHFWAFIVYNYNEEQVQILQITQAGIRKAIEALTRDQDWGKPHMYDLKIYKKGEGKETEYSVNPVPHKLLSETIERAFFDRPISLDALFDGQDPFSKENARFEVLAGTSEIAKEEENFPCISAISQEEIDQLEKMLNKVPEFKKQVMTFLENSHKISSLEQLEKNMYEKIKFSVVKQISSMEYAQKMKDQEEDFPFAQGE